MVFDHIRDYVKTFCLLLCASILLLKTAFSYAENKPITVEVLDVAQLLAIAEDSLNSDSERAQVSAEKAYQYTQNTDNKEQKVRALLLLAHLAKQNKQHYLVQKYLAETEVTLPYIDNIDLSMQAYTLLATVSQDFKKYEASLAYSEKLLALAKPQKNNKELYLAYRQKGQTLQKLKRHEEALQTFLAAKTYSTDLSGFYKFQALWNLVGIAGALNDHPMRISYINKGIEELYKSNNTIELPKAYNQLARSQRHLGQYELAIENAKKAIVIAREHDNQAMVAFSSVTLSRIYRWLGSYEDALVYCRDAVNIYKALGDVNGFASAANALGLIYKHLDQNEYAIEYHQQVLALPVNKIRPNYLGAALRELAQQYFYIGKKDEALVFIKQAHDVYQKAKNVKGLASVQKIMGKFYLDAGDKVSALKAYDQAISYSRSVGDAWNEAEVLILIGVLKTNSSLIEAKESVLQGLSIAQNIQVKWIIEQAYSALIDIEEKNQNSEAVEQYTALKAKIQADIEQEHIQRMNANQRILDNDQAKNKAK